MTKSCTKKIAVVCDSRSGVSIKPLIKLRHKKVFRLELLVFSYFYYICSIICIICKTKYGKID